MNTYINFDPSLEMTGKGGKINNPSIEFQTNLICIISFAISSTTTKCFGGFQKLIITEKLCPKNINNYTYNIH